LGSIGSGKVSYSYWILLAGFLTLFVMTGVGFYAFGVFFKPIQVEFGWGRGVTSVAFLMFYFVQALSSPFIGRLTDRYGPKTMITVGGVVVGLGLFLLSLTSSLLHFYVAYGITGLGVSAMGMIPVSSVVSNWFVKRRGSAMGIVTAGMGTGGLVLPLIIGIYLIPNFGWRTAYQALILLSLFVIVIAQVVIRNRPDDAELGSDGVKRSGEVKAVSRSSDGWTLGSTLRMSVFWLITGAFVLFNLGQVGTSQHLIVHLTDIGFTLDIATVIFSAVNITSAVGKLFFGYISDRFKVEYCAMMGFLLGLAGTVVLILVDPSSSIVLVGLYILTMGLAVGCWAPLTSMIIGNTFGMTHYATIFGAFSLFFYMGTGTSPTFFGIVYDTTHQYFLAYASALVFYSVATVLMLALLRLKRRSASLGATQKG